MAQRKGNLAALLDYWHDQMGGGSGQAGDFDACVAALSNHDNIDDPKALCAWLHQKATGASPGHAASEQPAKNSQETPMPENTAAFAEWSTSTINDLPDSSFLYIESGGSKDSDGKTTPRSLRHFPVKDGSGKVDLPHVRNALARIPQSDVPDSVKSRCIAAARRLLGSADNSAFAADIATFAVSEPLARDETLVFRDGLLFRSGTYADKDFELTPAELQQVAADFAGPVPLDLEHMPTILDGKLGNLWAVEAKNDGQELHGVVALPRWLDDALGDAERKVSATFDRATKSLVGLALVLNPRVSDAALMSAYFASGAASDPSGDTDAADAFQKKGRYNTGTGQVSLQAIHDAAARYGATCRQANAFPTGGFGTGTAMPYQAIPLRSIGSSAFAAGHEMSAMQQIHDLAAAHGAMCEPHVPMSAGQPAPSATASQKKETRMSNFEKFMTWLGGSDDGEQTAAPAAQPAQTVAPVAPATSDQARFDAQQHQLQATQQRLAQLEEQNARLVTERIAVEAAAFADKYISEGRAFPAAHDAIVADYSARARQDLVTGRITMSDGTQAPTAVESLTALFDSFPKNMLSVEQLGPQVAKILTNPQITPGTGADSEKKLSEDEVRRLVGMTATGSAIVNGNVARADRKQ